MDMKNTKNALKAYGTVDAWLHTLLTLAWGWCKGSATSPGCFIPMENATDRDAGWERRNWKYVCMCKYCSATCHVLSKQHCEGDHICIHKTFFCLELSIY
jgi:hypothetical protein